MKLSQKERDTLKASFREMSLAEKAEYIWAYFKLPIVLLVVAAAFLASTVYRQVTKKEVLLYTAHINVTVGEDLEARLIGNFVPVTGADPKKAEVSLDAGLYLSDDPSVENHEYSYASKLKLMASIEAKQLDVVLMNREGYDLVSQEGYLLDLDALLSSDESLYRQIEPYLTNNTVILEDNAIEYALNEAQRYHAVTEEAANGIDITSLPMFQEAGFSDHVYLGVIANSPRLPAVIQYIGYLAAANSTEGNYGNRET